jgi:uncharacterized phosphosugar-binding protein
MNMVAIQYLDAVRTILNHLQETQLGPVDAAADLVVQALTHKGAVFCHGIGHGSEGDFLNRAGGLAAPHLFSFGFNLNDAVANCLKDRPRPEPFDRELETVRFAVKASNLRAGDVAMLGSVSGKNRTPVELALSARAMGAKVIGITAMKYTARVKSLHPSGKKLCDVSDVVIDNGAPYGDAAVDVPGYKEKMLPVSGVAAIVAGWMVWGRVMEKMAAAGTPPSTFISINRDDGKEYYDRNLAEFNQRGY